jgi:hypothetical protein
MAGDGSVFRRVSELARRGLPPVEITRMMRAEGRATSRNAVNVMVCRARKMDDRIPTFKLSRDGSIAIDCGEYEDALVAAAAARDMAPSTLAGLILDAVISEGLIDAVLDTEAA